MKTRKYVLAVSAVLGGVVFMCGGLFLLLYSPTPGIPKEAMHPTNPLNVVLIVSDALRADHIFAGRAGRPLMPFVSEMARQSVYFENATSQCSWTRPSMASVLTSTYAETHQVYFDDDPGGIRKADVVPESIETMAEYLKRAGFATIGVQTNGNLVAKFGFGRGFDTYDYLPDAPSEHVTAKALERLQGIGQPYFLYVHYIDPHVPYAPPEKYREGFHQLPASDDEKKTALDFLGYLMEHSDVKLGRKPAMEQPLLSPEGRDAVRFVYGSDVRYVDEEIGRLVAALPNPERTIFIIMSDHGESFWEHDHLGHGLTCYEEVVHVPLLVKCPGYPPTFRREPVESFSVLPTVAAVLGLPPDPLWQGTNILDAENTHDRPAFSWTTGPWQSMNIAFDSVRLGNWKLIVDQKRGENALFNLAEDPGEFHNAAQERPEIAVALHKLLEIHKKEAVAARGNRARQTLVIDAETAQDLERIGYKVGQ